MKYLFIAFIWMSVFGAAAGAVTAAEGIDEDEDTDEIGMAVELRDNVLLDSSIGKFMNDFYYTYSPFAARIIDTDEDPEREHLNILMSASFSLIITLMILSPAVIAVCVVFLIIILAGVFQKLFGLRARRAGILSLAFVLAAGGVLWLCRPRVVEYGEINAIAGRFAADKDWTEIKKNISNLSSTAADFGELDKKLRTFPLSPPPSGTIPDFSGVLSTARSLRKGTEKAAQYCKNLSGPYEKIKAGQTEWEKINSDVFLKSADAGMRFHAYKALRGISMKVFKMRGGLEEANKSYLDESAKTFLRMKTICVEWEKLKYAQLDPVLADIKAELAAWEKANRTGQTEYMRLYKIAREISLLHQKNSERNLFDGLGDDDQRVRQYAALGLGDIQSHEAVQKLITMLMDTREEIHPRDKAVRALRKIGDPSAIPALEKVVAGCDNMYIALDAFEALKELRKKPVHLK